jgi:peptide/nickel transport system permease protein
MTDEILLRIMDVVRSFPSIVLALAVVAATGQSVVNVVLVIGILDSPIFARIVRAEVLALRSSAFVEAAIAAGNPTWRILFVHLLPNAIRGATALIAVRMAWAVRISATLAFIGVGIQPPTPEWGAMIRQGAEYIISGEWWVATFPGVALVGVVLGFNLLGDGLQDLLDPKRRTSGR